MLNTVHTYVYISLKIKNKYISGLKCSYKRIDLFYKLSIITEHDKLLHSRKLA